MQRIYTDVVQTPTGDVLTGASVFIYQTGTFVAATVYSDNGITTVPQPLTTDGNGQFIAYAANGRYDIRVIKSGYADTWYRDVLLEDPTQGNNSGQDSSGALVTATGAATSRMLSLITADIAMPETKGAVGDGITDDSVNFASALSTYNRVLGASNSTYKLKNIILSNGQAFSGQNDIVKSGAGSNYIFQLKDYAPEVRDVYISDATTATAAIAFESGRMHRLNNAWILNSQNPITFTDSSSSGLARPIFNDVIADTFTGNGVTVNSRVSEIQATNIYLDSGISNSVTPGKLKPKAGTIGWNQVTSDHSIAVGGHLITNAITIDSEKGWLFTDAQLTKLSNCAADSHSGYGIRVDGNSSYMDFNGMFVGTSMGVYIGGTASHIHFDGLHTLFTGVVPPWGSATDFYSTAGPYYDITVADTASVIVDGNSWRGGKAVNVAAGAKLTVTGGERLYSASVGNIAAGVTVYFGSNGSQLTEVDTIWRVPYDGFIFLAQVWPQNAPGVGQSYTYTVRKNFADTAAVITITGAATFFGETYGNGLAVSKGDNVCIKLVTSGTAAVSRHQVTLQLLAP